MDPVGSATLPGPAALPDDPDEVIQAFVRDVEAAGLEVHTVRESRLLVDGRSGVEVEATFADRDKAIVRRTVAADAQLFRLGVLAAPDRLASPRVRRLLDSSRLPRRY